MWGYGRRCFNYFARFRDGGSAVVSEERQADRGCVLHQADTMGHQVEPSEGLAALRRRREREREPWYNVLWPRSAVEV